MKRFFIALLSLGIVVACNQENNQIQSGGDEFTELQRVPPSEVPNLVSAFGIMAPSGEAGGFVAFYSNQTYFAGVVQKLSEQHYRIQAVIGLYEEAESLIKTTGKKTTCQKIVKNKGRSQLVGTTSGNSLLLSLDSKTTVLNRVQVSPLLKNGLVIEWGCFNEVTGAFTSKSWSDIP